MGLTSALRDPNFTALRPLLMRLPASSLFLALALLAGCDSFSPSEALPPLVDATTDPAALVNNDEWMVVAVVSDGKAYPFPDSRFSASFSADGYVGGRTPANSYAGRYTAMPDGTLRTEDVFRTLVGSDKQTQKLEQILNAEINAATSFQISRDELQIRSAEGDGIRLRLNLFRYQ